MSDLESWIALSMVPEVGNITFRRLISVFGTPGAVFSAGIRELSAVNGMNESKARKIKQFSGWKDAKGQVEALRQNDAKLMTLSDPGYPDLLRQVEDAPAVIYAKGTLVKEDRFAIAVVGSRQSSPYGRFVAEKFSAALSGYGFTIVSGMARGIDTAAHVSALKAGGRTIAVLGSGLDMHYPPENRDLMERISASGCVISEFPFGTNPNKENFPRRNRLISGLSLGVIVAEAAKESGALITAGCALEQNREVFAVPGNITSVTSAGTNDLIRKGARLIQRPSDIVEELAPALKGFVKQGAGDAGRPRPSITCEERKICDILTGEPAHIDSLSRELALSPAKTLTLLLDLELKGIVRQTEGKRFYLWQTDF